MRVAKLIGRGGGGLIRPVNAGLLLVGDPTSKGRKPAAWRICLTLAVRARSIAGSKETRGRRPCD